MGDTARERAEADRRYNDALTALDGSLAHPPAPTPVPAPPDLAPPPLPDTWSGRWLHRVRDWLAPLLRRQHAFNAEIAGALDRSARASDDAWRAVERFETALVVFLQQITPFVDTKDRQLEAAARDRLDAHQRDLAALPELQGQVAVLQRATQMLKRELESAVSRPPASSQPPPSSPPPPVPGLQPLDSYKYVGFEDRFRGSDEEIRAKQRAYLPLFAGRADVLDLGCGRGEFLALLKAEGVRARGLDLNHEMAEVARERGLDVAEADALAYLSSLPDQSLGGLMAAQVVEHLEPTYLMRLLETAFAKLAPGAPIVVETINPACWLAFFSSYIRDFTHVRPVHPDTLQYLLQASGFTRVTVQYSAPVPDHMKMQPIALPAETLASSDPSARVLADAARVVNTNAAILNNLLFTYLDYAAVGYRS